MNKLKLIKTNRLVDSRVILNDMYSKVNELVEAWNDHHEEHKSIDRCFSDIAMLEYHRTVKSPEEGEIKPDSTISKDDEGNCKICKGTFTGIFPDLCTCHDKKDDEGNCEVVGCGQCSWEKHKGDASSCTCPCHKNCEVVCEHEFVSGACFSGSPFEYCKKCGLIKPFETGSTYGNDYLGGSNEN